MATVPMSWPDCDGDSCWEWIERDSGVSREAVESFRRRIEPHLIVDSDNSDGPRTLLCAAFPEFAGRESLARFLLGWNNDEEKAAEAFQRAVAWRIKYNADACREKLMRQGLLDCNVESHLGLGLEHLCHWDKVGKRYPERRFHKKE